MDLVLLLKAAVLGIVEGATEFVPVSSTGHLILVQNWIKFLRADEVKANAFAIFIQLGAILAVLWIYRDRFLGTIRNWRHDPKEQRLITNLVVGTLPAVVFGLPTEKWVESHFFKPLPVAIIMLLGGVAILLIERRNSRPRILSVDEVTVRLALGIGMIQVLAVLFPGVSRSGATIMGALVLGLSRRAAAEFSFFLAIPAIIGASAVKLIQARDVLSVGDIPLFAVGFVVAMIVALFVIKGLLALISHRSFIPFAWYRIVFGVILLALYWTGAAGF